MRITWAPDGGAAAAAAWWPSGSGEEAPAKLGGDDIIRFGGAAEVVRDGQAIEAAWRSPGSRTAVASAHVTVNVSPASLRIDVPADWHAHVFVGWKHRILLASSDLRALACALGAHQPSLEGIADFLAGWRAGAGFTPSLYDGTWDLHPGHSLVIHRDMQMNCQRSWLPERSEEFANQRLDATILRLRGHLGDLAGRILGEHGRAACLFSGGLDSTLAAATLLRRDHDKVVLFNVGGGLGTPAEASLRTRFLGEFRAASHSVDLPADAGLVASLRATNAVAPLPTGSLFTHVFEEIIAAARGHDCDVIVTGDGGDEVFVEHEEVLVDLLARRSPALPTAIGFFAVRNGERGTQVARRTVRNLRALRAGTMPVLRVGLGDLLLGEDLALYVAAARMAASAAAGEMWAAGWTCSGIGSYQRGATVPEWEPVSAGAPGFPVVSPLADATIMADALALRRDEVVPRVYGSQPKWLLRQAALDWLPREIAMHPKIGSADGQILARVRSAEHDDLLDLLSSVTACSAGLAVPAKAEDPNSPLWQGEDWLKAAAVAAWLSQPPAQPWARPAITVAATSARDTCPPLERDPELPRGAAWRVAVIAILNLAAQLAVLMGKIRPAAVPTLGTTPETGLARHLADLARRACAIPFVSGAPQVMAGALAWYLRFGGKDAVVVRGPVPTRHEIWYWIEANGRIVDVSATESPLGSA
jgi:asparagine synthetase B (glutamine-hydrolysing)